MAVSMQDIKVNKYRSITFVINGIPYVFPSQWVLSEKFSSANHVQVPWGNPRFPPIITPIRSSVEVKINVCMWQRDVRATYRIARAVLRTTQKLFATSDKENVDEQEKFILSFHPQTFTEDGEAPVIKQEPQVKETVGSNRVKIPFSDNLNVPWQMQVSCAYVGLGINMACCTLDSFKVKIGKNSAGLYQETWTIKLSEYDLQYVNTKDNPETAYSTRNETN